jgi:predicted DNA-binding protein (MmcQ/YjbR family)
MNLEEVRDFCLKLPYTSEDFPFDDEVLVFKVGSKLFALTGISSVPFRVNLKCNPDYAIELREFYEEVEAGYHMNKKHWNTVNFQGKLPKELLLKLIKDSYDLVFNGLTKKEKDFLKNSN